MTMSHESGNVIVSLFEIFDPNDPDYAGVREHFSTSDLAEIDRIRALPPTHHYTLKEKLFVIHMCATAVITGD
jgi:hypothetical protein